LRNCRYLARRQYTFDISKQNNQYLKCLYNTCNINICDIYIDIFDISTHHTVCLIYHSVCVARVTQLCYAQMADLSCNLYHNLFQRPGFTVKKRSQKYSYGFSKGVLM